MTFLLFYGIMSQTMRGDSMSVLTQNIKRGVPISSPVILRAVDIISLFENPKQTEKIITAAQGKLMDYIASLGPTEDIEFFQTMQVKTDENTLEKSIIFAPSAIMSTLVMNLNMPVVNFSNGLTNKEFLKWAQQETKPYLSKLQRMQTSKELQRNFPSLYLKYEKRLEAERQLKLCAQNLSRFSAIERMFIKQNLKQFGVTNIPDFIHSKPTSVNKFSRDCTKALQNIVDHVPEIIAFMEQHPINFESLSPRNKEKLDLYLASEFIKAAKTYGSDDPQRYLIFVANYFKENPDKKQDDKLQITVGNVNNVELGRKEQGVTITPKDVYNQYKEFVVSHPEIQLLSFGEHELDGLTLKEAEEFVRTRLEDIQANWKFLPKSELDQIAVATGKQIGAEHRTEEEKRRKQERLLDLFMEKKEFYEQTDPFFRIKGENTFNGYIGYIYPNGKVILDKFFENAETGRVADGQAIYTMDFTDFVRLSILPKSELIENPACRRIVHAGNWQSRVQEEINAPKTSDTSAVLKDLESTGKVYVPR